MAKVLELLVVGGGIVGLLSALELRRAGLNVRVLERGALSAESSWAGAGILSPLLPWQYGDAVNQLCQRGAGLHESLAGELFRETGIDPEYWCCGMMVLPPFDISLAQEWCAGRNLVAETLSGGGLHLADVSQVRNPRLLRALRRRLEQLEVPLQEGMVVTGLRTHSGRVEAVETLRGPLAADQVVICAGAWTRRLLEGTGAGLPIRPVRGQMLLFKGRPGDLDTILYRDGIYLVPRRDGHILVGSTLEEAGFDKSTTTEARDWLLGQARELFPPIAGMPLLRQWSGLRPGSPGNIPVIARHPEIENLWVNAGHFRYGVTMAPASAEILAALVTGKSPPIPAEPYRWPGG